MRLRLLIEYEGTHYAGWQIQKKKRTVQGEIEKAINTVLREPAKIVGAGRTDAGVHARGQVAHTDLNKNIDDLFRFARSLNGILDNDIRIKAISRVPDDFHARFSAIAREYRYTIARKPRALDRNYCWFLNGPLDIDSMNACAPLLLGKNDFKSFCRTISKMDHYFCTVQVAQWIEQEELLLFIIRADRFLHGMVRALVGTCIDIGRAKIKSRDLPEIFASQNRRKASQAAPAKGLILHKIYY